MQTLTEFLTELLVIITGYYAWVTHRILKSNEKSVKFMADQIKNQHKNDIFVRTFEQVKRLEDRDFRDIRQYVLGTWDGNYPTGDSDRDKMIKEFSHTMDTIGALYCKGYLDKDLLSNLYGGFIVNGYRKVSNFINYTVKTKKVESYQVHFDQMAKDVEQNYRKLYPNGNWLNLDTKDLID